MPPWPTALPPHLLYDSLTRMDVFFTIVSEVFSLVKTIIGNIASSLLEFVPKILNFLVWCLAGALILPCVFIANTFYPLWEEWAKKLKTHHS
jgi:hypothetical protein